jgi:hypothetical protein
MGLTASSMATLRPLFKTFLARSRLIGSSNKRASSRAWPQPNQPSRNGYFRSGSKNGNDGVEEMGLSDLRYDLRRGVGNSTIIESLNDPRSSDDDRKGEGEQKAAPGDKYLEAGDSHKRFKRFGSGHSKIMRSAASPGSWDPNDESYVATDSSSEKSTVPGGLGIRKTTQVTTARE